MERLNAECEEFIVQGLACLMSPTEVVMAVRVQFDVDISEQRVQRFDPAKTGGARLSQPLRDLFAATRERYIETACDVGLAHLRYRLEVLQHLLHCAKETNKHWLALQCLEIAAKEVGGWYMRRHDGKGGAGLLIARLLTMNTPVGLDEH